MCQGHATMTLPFDGSDLGVHDWNAVVCFWWPHTEETSSQRSPILQAGLKIADSIVPVLLKRNQSKKTDQVVVDELKSLFGLHKMGTHRIRLHGVPRKVNENYHWADQGTNLNTIIHPQWSDYIILKGPTRLRSDGVAEFFKLPTLETLKWIPSSSSVTPDHRNFYFEIKKVIVFRELLGVTDTNDSNILVRTISGTILGKESTDVVFTEGKYVPLSIDEMNIRYPRVPFKRIPRKEESFLFGSDTARTETLIKMLGLHQEIFPEQIETLRSSLARIIQRVDQEKLWLVDHLTAKITDQISLYYNLRN